MIKTSFMNTSLPTPALHRWLLGSLMVAVIALGWKYPLLGFVVPVAMLTGMAGGALRGRYVCGNFCPRGSFFDTFFARFGPVRQIPEKLFGLKLRGLVMLGLMSFMTYRLMQNPEHLAHWGAVFWQMCLITTLVALVLGLIYRPRTWCAICPVGTMAHVTGGRKMLLAVAENCSSCRLCEKNCPMGLEVSDFKINGTVQNSDCLQCGTCVNVCPVSALSLQKTAECLHPAWGDPDSEDMQRAA